ILSNKTLSLLDLVQKVPIDKMNSMKIHQENIDKMSVIILILYREYAGMFFKSQKLINQLKRLEQ
ncbi:DNA repair protein RecO, partial [Staphylococcus aureus]